MKLDTFPPKIYVDIFEFLIAAPKTNLNNYARPINCSGLVFLRSGCCGEQSRAKQKARFSLPDVSHDRARKAQNTMPKSHQGPHHPKHVDRESLQRARQKAINSL